MRAIKYLEYRAFIAAQLLYPCSSPMELSLTVVSITTLMHAINTQVLQWCHNIVFLWDFNYHFVCSTMLSIFDDNDVFVERKKSWKCHNLLYFMCDTLAPYRHTIKSHLNSHCMTWWDDLRLNETIFSASCQSVWQIIKNLLPP